MLKRIENFINSCEKNIIYLNNLGKFNHKNRFIVIDNNNISLTEKESDLIYFLYKNEQSDEEEILQNIWGRENNTDGRVLETITRNLRQKLKNLSIKKQLIVNNNGHYRLET
jgi:DNA-binding response OmpR family regulator